MTRIVSTLHHRRLWSEPVYSSRNQFIAMLLLGCQCQRLNLVHGVEIRIYKLQRLFFRLINLRVNLR